jgi:phage terminase large subunit
MRKILLIIFFQLSFSSSFAEILVFKNCTNKDYSFEKNEYILDVEKGVMTREFIYSNETYERLRLNDVRVEKENSNTKGISKVDGQIISEISGYPAFYTQMIFDTFDKTIKIKSVLNNTAGISVISKCEKIIKYKLES